MISNKTVSTEEDIFHITAEAMNYDDRTKVLNQSDSFAIFDRWGNIHPDSKTAHGIFHEGTRYINKLELRINRKKPLLLSSSIKEDNDILSVDLTNPELVDCNVLENSLHISRSQFIRNGVFYEELFINNYSEGNCPFHLTIAFGADFRDLFEIRGIDRNLEVPKAVMSADKNKLVFNYEGLDKIKRRTEIIFPGSEDHIIEKNMVSFPITLKPHEQKKIHYLVIFRADEPESRFGAIDHIVTDFSEAKALVKEDLKETHALFANIYTSNEQFTNWINRSRSDIVSLLTTTPHGIYPYAGVPWYNTAFGRDGIITAMELLWVAPEISRNVLMFLAALQATENIPSKDAEPGKIMHEVRSGEMANTGEIPFKEYYGTIDATPLFIMLAGMYYQHTADVKTIQKLWPNIIAALGWIDVYGDLDGDGFVEYQHKAENGLTNQGWKDSHDSIMYANGQFCEPPIALCEVQGYVYAAKKHASILAAALGEQDHAATLNKEAEALKTEFNKVFWDEGNGCFALALDKNKKPCKVVSSNPGHCLFTGIVDEKHAATLAKTLTSEDMFSGWGVRTLSVKEKRYNPMSYHNGSIWPHDNALMAYGLAKYGFQEEALKILSALFNASLFIELQRLPELYCGFEKRPGEGPTSYPVACSPQAWSVAAVYLLLQACLHLEVNAIDKVISFHKPVLPDYLNKVVITNLRIGDDVCDVELNRYKHDIGFHVMKKPADWKLIIVK